MAQKKRPDPERTAPRGLSDPEPLTALAQFTGPAESKIQIRDD